MPRRASETPFRLKHLAGAGALLGLAALGAAWILLSPLLRGDGVGDTGVGASGLVFYYVFSLLGIVSAVRVITHPRPVYSALWFVMVVIASSGLFLVLAAEFMAFAMIIIYGGAILVTYMFVIMLATEPRAGDDDDLPDYEQYAREPLCAVGAAFLLLAVLLSFIFQPQEPNPQARAQSDAEVALLLDRPAGVDRLVVEPEAVTAVLPIEASPPPATTPRDAVAVPDAALVVSGVAAPPLDADGPRPTVYALAETPAPVTNLQRVGLDLFRANPLAVELAGVILLLSLIGAVVVANTRVPAEEEGQGPGPEAGRSPTDPIEKGPEKAGVGGAEVVQVA